MKVLACAALLLFAWCSSQAADVIPLAQAHAHNDYLHSRPLLDALDNGFRSVEADIHLVDGKLLVAHEPEQVNPARTLEALYLEPLKAHLAKGAKRGEFALMIDIKTEPESTYAALRDVLKKYAPILTTFRPNTIETNIVTVVISGNRPINTISNEPVRYAGIDGRLTDLESNPPRSLVPWISDNWMKHFAWRGDGSITDAERTKLRSLVEQAHQQGRKIRLWAIPDNRIGWEVVRAAGVDLINTDDLPGLRDFLIPANTNK